MNLRDEVDVKGLLRGGSGLLELALFLLDPPAMVGIENEDSSSLRPPSYCATPPGIMKHPEYYNEKADFVVQVRRMSGTRLRCVWLKLSECRRRPGPGHHLQDTGRALLGPLAVLHTRISGERYDAGENRQ